MLCVLLALLCCDGTRADEGAPRSPLVQAVVASENPEVNNLNSHEGRLERLCFDAARTVCMCRARPAGGFVKSIRLIKPIASL